MPISTIKYKELSGKFRLDASFYKQEYLEVEKELKSKKNVLSLSKLGTKYEKTIDPSKKPTEYFNYLDISNVDISDGTVELQNIIGHEAPSRARKKVKEDSLMISTVRPNRNAITIINKENENIVVSTGFFVLNVTQIDPLYLFTYLKTDYAVKQLVKRVSNAMYPTVLEGDISEILVYVPNDNFQKKIRKQVLEAFKLKKESKQIFQKVNKSFEDKVGVSELKTSPVVEIKHSEFFINNRLDATYYKKEYLDLIKILKKQKNVRLGSLCKIRNGFPFESEYFDLGDYPLIKIANIRKEEINIKMCTSIPKEYFGSTSFKLTNEGNIIIGMDGTDEFRAALITNKLTDSAINQRIAILEIDKAKINPHYLLEVLNSKVGQYQLVREKSLASTVGHLSNEIIKNLIIPILEKRICDKISNLIKNAFEKNYQARKLIEKSIIEVEEYVSKSK